MNNENKKAWTITSKPDFKFSVWPVIAFGYYSQSFIYDKYNGYYYRTLYFLCFKLTSTEQIKPKF